MIATDRNRNRFDKKEMVLPRTLHTEHQTKGSFAGLRDRFPVVVLAAVPAAVMLTAAATTGAGTQSTWVEASDEIAFEASGTGAHDFLQKPFTVETLPA